MFINISFGEHESVRILKEMLEIANADRKQLLDALLNLTKPEVVQAPPTVINPIIQQGIPWHRRKQALEEEARNEARIKAKSERIEKELGVENAATGE